MIKLEQADGDEGQGMKPRKSAIKTDLFAAELHQ